MYTPILWMSVNCLLSATMYYLRVCSQYYWSWTCSLLLAGALGLKFEITELESVKNLQIVCKNDGREIHSAEQLKEHLAMRHKDMWLLREDDDLDAFGRAVNLDRIFPIISKLTTGNPDENVLVWAKDKQLVKFLDVSQSTMILLDVLCENGGALWYW